MRWWSLLRRPQAATTSGIAEVRVENPDREALVALYEATDGPNWQDDSNWLTDAPLGYWHGVSVDAAGHVIHLDLTGNGLTGSIPSELGGLAHLEALYLSGPV